LILRAYAKNCHRGLDPRSIIVQEMPAQVRHDGAFIDTSHA